MLSSGRKIRNTRRMAFSSKNTSYPKYAKFSASFFFLASENNFLRFDIKNWVQTSCQIDSRCKTILMVALRIVSTMMGISWFCKAMLFLYVNDGVNYFISFHSSYHLSSNYTSFFFLFFPSWRKIFFTGTITILGGIRWFSNLNKMFSHKLSIDSESAQKTESNDVSFKLIWSLSFFFIFSGIAEELNLICTGRKMKVIKLTWKIHHLTQFLVYSKSEYTTRIG
jgi:hypothetical protein